MQPAYRQAEVAVEALQEKDISAWRPRGVLLRGMLALLLGALPAAVAVIGIRNAATMGTGHFVYRGSLSYGAIHFLCQLLLGVSLAFAWYGFVAERLRRWMPPLAIALVIGLAVRDDRLAAWLGVAFGSVTLGLSGWAWAAGHRSDSFRLRSNATWIGAIGVHWRLGVDSLSEEIASAAEEAWMCHAARADRGARAAG